MEILAVSPDTHRESNRLLGELSGDPSDLVLLADPDHAVIDRYGLRNMESSRGIPHPTTFVIDREGVVQWRFVETDYKVRASNEDILEALARLESK